MRYLCPNCFREFTDEIGACPDDGARLLAVQDTKADALVGTTLDNRFHIDRLLGEGGMGAVYVGTQTSIGRQVAIKVIRSQVSHDAEAVKRFHREGQVISRITHSNVVHVVDFGQTQDGLLYLAMEYVRGRPLTEEIARGPMPAGRVLAIISQVCDALAAAHDNGVVHRDLKPDNILLTSQAGNADYVKVLDFGIAKVASDGPCQATALTQAGSIMGTPQYMSPEQIDGSEITASADLYALAVIAFEMLAGVPPFQDETPITLLIKHLKDEPPTIRQVAPGVQVAPAIEAFLLKNLAKGPAARSRHALAFKEELAAAMAGPGSAAAISVAPLPPTRPHAVAEPAPTLLSVSAPAQTATTGLPVQSLAPEPMAAPVESLVVAARPEPALAPGRPSPRVWIAAGAAVLALATAIALLLSPADKVAQNVVQIPVVVEPPPRATASSAPMPVVAPAVAVVPPPVAAVLDPAPAPAVAAVPTDPAARPGPRAAGPRKPAKAKDDKGKGDFRLDD